MFRASLLDFGRDLDVCRWPKADFPRPAFNVSLLGIKQTSVFHRVRQASQRSAAMSGWSRMLVAAGGVAMVASGLLIFEGYRSAWVLTAAAAVLVVVSLSITRKRSS